MVLIGFGGNIERLKAELDDDAHDITAPHESNASLFTLVACILSLYNARTGTF